VEFFLYVMDFFLSVITGHLSSMCWVVWLLRAVSQPLAEYKVGGVRVPYWNVYDRCAPETSHFCNLESDLCYILCCYTKSGWAVYCTENLLPFFHHQSLLFFTLDLKHTSFSSLFHRRLHHRYSLDWSLGLPAGPFFLAVLICFSLFR